MNTRIKELAEQCTSLSNAGYYTNISDLLAHAASPREVFDKEKFAELIVSECIDVVEGAGGIGKYHYTEAISKHFEVE